MVPTEIKEGQASVEIYFFLIPMNGIHCLDHKIHFFCGAGGGAQFFLKFLIEMFYDTLGTLEWSIEFLSRVLSRVVATLSRV